MTRHALVHHTSRILFLSCKNAFVFTPYNLFSRDVNLKAGGITVEVVIDIVLCILAFFAAALAFAIIYKQRKSGNGVHWNLSLYY